MPVVKDSMLPPLVACKGRESSTGSHRCHSSNIYYTIDVALLVTDLPELDVMTGMLK